MRTRNIITFALMAGALIISLMFNPAVVAQPPEPVLKTGDLFSYSTENNRDQSYVWSTEVYDTNDTALHLDERGWNDVSNEVGNAELSFIDTARKTYLPNAFKVESYSEALNGSVSTWYDNVYDDFNGDNIREWDNRTDSEDRSGMMYYHEDAFPSMSNSTYAIIFPEMVDDFVRRGFEFHDIYLEGVDWRDFEEIPLESRYVDQYTDYQYNINGVNYSLNVNYVSATFSDTKTGTSSFWLDTPNGSYRMAANYTLDQYYYVDMVYDQDTTMLLDRYEYEYYDFFVEFANESIMMYPDHPPALSIDTHEGMEISFYGDISRSGSNTNYVVIEAATSMYGESRPLPSGTNRLQAGDFREYFVYAENGFRIDSSRIEDGYSNSEIVEAKNRGFGNMTLDVYYHEDGYFQAAIYGGLTSFGHYYQMRSEDHGNGDSWQDEFNQTEFRFNPIFDLFEATSNSSFEIAPFFEDTYWYELPFGDEGPGGERESMEIPLVGTGTENNVTTMFVNGYNRTFNTIDVYAVYLFEVYNESAMIEVNEHEGISILGTEEGRIEVIDGWRFDADTGILLAHIQDVDLKYHAEASGSYTDMDNNTRNVSVSRNVDLKDTFAFGLHQIPGYYTTPPGTSTSDTSDSRSSSDSSSTDSSTSSSTNTTSSSGNSSDVPTVPVQAVPLFMAMLSIALVPRLIRKN